MVLELGHLQPLSDLILSIRASSVRHASLSSLLLQRDDACIFPPAFFGVPASSTLQNPDSGIALLLVSSSHPYRACHKRRAGQARSLPFATRAQRASAPSPQGEAKMEKGGKGRRKEGYQACAPEKFACF